MVVRVVKNVVDKVGTDESGAAGYEKFLHDFHRSTAGTGFG